MWVCDPQPPINSALLTQPFGLRGRGVAQPSSQKPAVWRLPLFVIIGLLFEQLIEAGARIL
jgi:hypothetical protein